jgi:hypothetical protein
MLKCISLQRKHLAKSLLASSVSFLLINHRIEGCPLGCDLGTKIGEVDKWTIEVEGPVVEEWDCGIGPPSEALVPVFCICKFKFFFASLGHIPLICPHQTQGFWPGGISSG